MKPPENWVNNGGRCWGLKGGWVLRETILADQLWYRSRGLAGPAFIQACFWSIINHYSFFLLSHTLLRQLFWL